MRQLAAVFPVYNEDECIRGVLEAWQAVFAHIGIDYEMIALDDGSTDSTALVLASLAMDDRVTVVSKPHGGHGPTILRGYLMAVERAEWVFQCDGDDEMDASAFATFWSDRASHDAVFGIRLGRRQSLGRRFISWVSRAIVTICFSRGVQDVNVPYRLMRSTLLAPVVESIPETTFAPNLVISGALALSGAHIENLPVPHRPRRTGQPSIASWRLWKASAVSLIQTVALAPSMRAVAQRIRAQSHRTGETK